MAVTKKVVKKATTEEPKKAVVAKKAEAPAPAPKKAVVAKKAEPAKKAVAPKKAEPEKKTGKKVLSLSKKTSSNDNFKLVEGKQATQDQYISILHKKLVALGYDAITKEDVRKIQKANSETLKEVTNLCSFQDTTAGIFYARREIDARVTAPPKAADGLQTLMLKHYELKVRKVLADEDSIKFSGTLSDDGTTFITTEGKKIKVDTVAPATSSKEEAEEEEEVDEEVEETEEVEEEEEETDEELLEEED